MLGVFETVHLTEIVYVQGSITKQEVSNIVGHR